MTNKQHSNILLELAGIEVLLGALLCAIGIQMTNAMVVLTALLLLASSALTMYRSIKQARKPELFYINGTFEYRNSDGSVEKWINCESSVELSLAGLVDGHGIGENMAIAMHENNPELYPNPDNYYVFLTVHSMHRLER